MQRSTTTPRDSSIPSRRHPLALVVFVALVVTATLLSMFYPPQHEAEVLTHATTPNRVRLTLVLADTATKRSRGLSELHSLSHEGLLLLWPEAGQHPIWMEGMRFPLDLIWCDGAGRVLAIERNVPPCTPGSECPLYGLSAQNGRAVIELGANQAQALQLHVGESLTIEALTKLSQE
jgi:uncharacterized membrane protein (UPF0127 family)